MGSKSTFFVVRVSRGCHNFLPQSGTLDKVFHSRVQCIPWESEANVSRSQSADKKNNISNTNEGGIKSPWFMDVKITMQVDCWKRCYCGELWLLIMLLDFFFSFPSSPSVLCRLSAYFLLLQEQWNLYFKGGFAELSIRQQTLKRARPEKWQRLLDYYLAW